MLAAGGEMFINLTIIISFLTFGNYFIRDKGINPSSPLARKIAVGLVTGIVSCLLMVYSIDLPNKIIIDLRYIPLIIIAFHGSAASAITAAILAAVFRLGYFGFGGPSIVAAVVVVLVAVIFGLISRLNVKRYVKWIMAVLVENVLTAIAMSFFLAGDEIFVDILILYFTANAVAAAIMYLITDHVEQTNSYYRKIKEEAGKDFLTGLNNVRQYDTLLNYSVKNAREKKEKLSMLYIDIDFFKRVNDTYGHTEGDNILIQLSNILKGTCRSHDIVSRNGGEEFSVLLQNCDLSKAVEVAERIRKRVEEHDFQLSTGKSIRITISIGVSSFPETTIDPDKLEEHADIALYNSKRTGRNKVSVFGG